jgi:hypothetical protein
MFNLTKLYLIYLLIEGTIPKIFQKKDFSFLIFKI